MKVSSESALSADDLIDALYLAPDGRWALVINGIELVFPLDSTRAEVESVLREAWAVQCGS